MYHHTKFYIVKLFPSFNNTPTKMEISSICNTIFGIHFHGEILFSQKKTGKAKCTLKYP